MKPYRYILIISLAIFSNSSIAQNQSVFDEFYKVTSNIINRKIDKYQIPLNGNQVKMIPFRQGKLFGFVKKNKPKKWIIKPKFEQVMTVYKAGAIVKHKGYYGLINHKNKWLIPPFAQNLFKEQDVFHSMSKSKYLDDELHLPLEYRESIKNAYFNINGELIFVQNAHDQKSFTQTDTLAWFRYGSEYIIRGKSGKIHSRFNSSERKSFLGISSNTIVFAEKEGFNFYYKGYNCDNTKIFEIRLPYKNAISVNKLSSNLYGAIFPDNEYHFFDSLGLEKPYGISSGIVGIYNSDLSYFNQDQFTVRDKETNKFGVINKKGKVLIEFEYDYIGSFVDSMAYYTKNTYRKGFVYLNGDTLAYSKEKEYLLRRLPIEMNKALNIPVLFTEGLTSGKMQNYIISKTIPEDKNHLHFQRKVDRNGDSVYVHIPIHESLFYCDKNLDIKLWLKPNITFAGPFNEGLAPALNDKKKLGFINKNGNWVIEPEFELQATGRYLNIQIAVPQFIGGFAYIKAIKGYIDKKGNKYFGGKKEQDKYDFSH